MGTNPGAPGICQRLINFILGMVINNRTQAHHGLTEVPILEGSSRNGPIDSSDQIVVDFRHTRDHFSRKTDLEKMISIQESEDVKGAKHLANAQAKLMVNDQSHDQDAKARPTRRPGPIMRVASNINEKSDAYIQRRKKAISRNDDSHDHEDS